jgi:hypothetical protein
MGVDRETFGAVDATTYAVHSEEVFSGSHAYKFPCICPAFCLHRRTPLHQGKNVLFMFTTTRRFRAVHHQKFRRGPS